MSIMSPSLFFFVVAGRSLEVYAFGEFLGDYNSSDVYFGGP